MVHRRMSVSGFLFLGVLISLLYALPALAQTPDPDTAPDQHVGCFGDSITQGIPYIDSDGNGRRVGGYEPDLESLMNNGGTPAFVYNWGDAAETTAQGVNRINNVLDQRSFDYMLILEGTNDPGAGLSIRTTKTNLGLMIDACIANGATPYLATLTPDTRGGMEDFKDIAGRMNPAITDLASSKNITLVDLYQAVIGNWNNLNYDGIHPNREGYEVLAQTWYSALQSDSSGGDSEGDDDDGDGGGCFIATAAFGSPMESHVGILRQFRDRVLLRNTWGRKLVSLYYQYSPGPAKYIAKHEPLKIATRWVLLPLVGLSALYLKWGLPAMFMFAFGAGMLIGATAHFGRKMRSLS